MRAGTAGSGARRRPPRIPLPRRRPAPSSSLGTRYAAGVKRTRPSFRTARPRSTVRSPPASAREPVRRRPARRQRGGPPAGRRPRSCAGHRSRTGRCARSGIHDVRPPRAEGPLRSGSICDERRPIDRRSVCCRGPRPGQPPPGGPTGTCTKRASPYSLNIPAANGRATGLPHSLGIRAQRAAVGQHVALGDRKRPGRIDVLRVQIGPAHHPRHPLALLDHQATPERDLVDQTVTNRPSS